MRFFRQKCLEKRINTALKHFKVFDLVNQLPQQRPHNGQPCDYSEHES
jgi:hypothetical protein